MTTGRNDSREERFESLYRRHYARVFRWYVVKWRLADDEAHDLAQDVFASVYKNMDQYRGDAEWAFLEKIARNLLYNRNRALHTAKRKGDHVPIDTPELADRLAASPEPDYAERELDALQRKQLREAIAALPEGMRQALELWLQDYSYAAIRQVLRITPDAVKSRLRDARKLLQERLGPDLAGTLPEDNDNDQ
jgi:RNA polymerase sigma factor (sigma-70 family)